jgi:hypothetical protein
MGNCASGSGADNINLIRQSGNVMASMTLKRSKNMPFDLHSNIHLGCYIYTKLADADADSDHSTLLPGDKQMKPY